MPLNGRKPFMLSMLVPGVNYNGSLAYMPCRTPCRSPTETRNRTAVFTIEAVPMYNENRGPSEGKFLHEKGRGNGYIATYGGLRAYIAPTIQQACPRCVSLRTSTWPSSQ